METKPVSSSSDAILSFDLGKKCTAWAITENGLFVDYGTIGFLPKQKTSDLYLGLRHLMARVMDNFAPERVAFEYAAFQRGHALEQFHALSMAVKVGAHEARIPCYKVPSANIKRVMTGKGNAKKPEMIRAVNKMMGLSLDPERETPDSDIADAIATGVALHRSILDNTHKATLAS